VIYLDAEDLLHIADRVVKVVEIRDIGLLAAAAARPRTSVFGQDAYATMHEKAAALVQSIVRDHALVDGNKRLALAATRYFLIKNGTDVRLPSPREGDRFIRQVAQGQVELADLARQLKAWSAG